MRFLLWWAGAVWRYLAALDAGAYGLVISSAGPTLLALAATSKAEQARSAIATAWEQEGIAATAQVVQIDYQGAVVDASI